METVFEHKKDARKRATTRFKVMLADGQKTYNDWSANSSDLNVRRWWLNWEKSAGLHRAAEAQYGMGG